jgi:hypothetical protein
MVRYEASATIEAPVESVWRRLADVVRWSQWTPTVAQVDALDRPELALGHRYRVRQPKLRPTVWTVTLLEAPLRFTWETRFPGVRMVADHILERRPSGETALTLRFSFDGWLGPLVGRLYRKLVRSYLATEAACLRTVVEKSLP